MNYCMVYLMIFVSAIFFGVGVGCLIYYIMRKMYILCGILSGIALFCGNYILTGRNHRKMMKIYQAYKKKWT